MLAPAYLMTYELLWSPQNSSDSLTSEELLTKYPDLHSTERQTVYMLQDSHQAVDSITSKG